MKSRDIQLSELIDTSKPKNVLREVKNIFLYHFPQRHFREVMKCYTLIVDLFQGRFPGYKACNTEYHNLSHTLDALLASSRLIDGYFISRGEFPMPLTINLLKAALFHDTGYIQEDWDKEGTGAKYTANHVERSIAFLVKHRDHFIINEEDVAVISRIIKSTGLSVNMNTIPFQSKQEEIAGTILGTADLLGQMSDRVYLEKLLFLYYEFKEAGIQGFDTEFDIIRKTVDFYGMAKNKFMNDYLNTYRYAKYHFKERFGVDNNLYMKAINRHISYLKKIIKDDTTNFRHKLKRAPWVHDDISSMRM
jgi:hypothetical protein